MGKPKAKCLDRIILNSKAPKYMRDKYGTKTGRITMVDTSYASFDTSSRAAYNASFDSRDPEVLLYSYQFNLL